MLFAKITGLASGDNVLVAADAGGRSIVLTHFYAACLGTLDGTITATFMSDVGGGAVALSGAMPMSQGIFANVPSSIGCVRTAPGKALNLKLSANLTVAGYLSYYLD